MAQDLDSNSQFSLSLCLSVCLFPGPFSLSGAELDESHDVGIMMDADDTQLHTAESDDVL